LFWSYFSSPFPKAEGFSAYRMPGMLVHLPVIVVFAVIGFWLCVREPWLLPLLLVYAIVGLYVGRDLAILAHYNPLITIVVLVGAFFLVGAVPDWPRPAPSASIAVTAALALLFAWYVKWRMRGETEHEPRLHALVRRQDLKAIAAALESGANPNEPAHDDSTPLRLAVEKGNAAIARLLLDRGADARRPGRRGWTPLHAAVHSGDREMMELLLAAGADINAGRASHSILGEAARAERFDLIPWLLEKGAKADAETFAMTALAGSRQPRAIETLQRLIQAGARVSDELLMPAATPEMIRFLAAQGARAERLPPDKNPVFVQGDVRNRPERLRALRELGCDLAAADGAGRTVLHYVCNVESAPMLGATLAVLLPAGLDVNATDEDGETAIYWLVKGVLPYVTGRNIVGLKERLPVETAIGWVGLLLDAGADPRVATKAGEDAIALAKRLGAPRAFRKRLER
jgi:ankyrin repeat protein